MTKFSYELLSAAFTLMEIATAELGSDSEEFVNQMFNAINPSLKNQMLLYLLRGEQDITIKYDHRKDYKAINAIKAIRYHLGLGLAESKKIIDNALLNGQSTLDTNGVNWNNISKLQLKQKLNTDLQDTGFYI